MSEPSTRSGFVAITGRPNVGKSTLTNFLVGEKVAIVSDVPQTTRHRIQGMRNLPGGQIVVVDTPGIHKPRHAMNRHMVETAAEAMRSVDLILFLIEATGAGPGDRFVISMLPRERPPVILVINKVDTVKKMTLLPLIDEMQKLFPFKEIMLISALTGENASDLPQKLLPYLPVGPPLFPEEYITDQQERFMAAELIREKILHHTRQEIPHETCVMIDSFKEDDSGLRSIEATVLVEKDSQKGIVIGREGSMLKVVGTEAREELEKIFGGKVFLKLWVKVRPGWRDNETVLGHLGFAPHQ